MTQAIISAVLLVAGIGLVASLLISVASTFMSVKVNEKEVAVRDCLPGANCGACGYSGCDAYAKAVAEDSSVPANLCRPGGASVAKAVADVMGVEVLESKPMAAFVHCHGDCFNNAQKEIYYGLESCAAAKMLYGGKGACTAGCLGCGLGFLLAMVIFAGVRSKVEDALPPKSFSGIPITLISASIVSVAFYGFGGVIEKLVA